jgi:hypothetical protein
MPRETCAMPTCNRVSGAPARAGRDGAGGDLRARRPGRRDPP